MEKNTYTEAARQKLTDLPDSKKNDDQKIRELQVDEKPKHEVYGEVSLASEDVADFSDLDVFILKNLEIRIKTDGTLLREIPRACQPTYHLKPHFGTEVLLSVHLAPNNKKKKAEPISIAFHQNWAKSTVPLICATHPDGGCPKERERLKLAEMNGVIGEMSEEEQRQFLLQWTDMMMAMNETGESHGRVNVSVGGITFEVGNEKDTSPPTIDTVSAENFWNLFRFYTRKSPPTRDPSTDSNRPGPSQRSDGAKQTPNSSRPSTASTSSSAASHRSSRIALLPEQPGTSSDPVNIQTVFSVSRQESPVRNPEDATTSEEVDSEAAIEPQASTSTTRNDLFNQIPNIQEHVERALTEHVIDKLDTNIFTSSVDAIRMISDPLELEKLDKSDDKLFKASLAFAEILVKEYENLEIVNDEAPTGNTTHWQTAGGDIKATYAAKRIESGQIICQLSGSFFLTGHLPHIAGGYSNLFTYEKLSKSVCIHQWDVYLRRSCKPNAEVKVVRGTRGMRMLVVAKKKLDKGAEVTIAFEEDWMKSTDKLTCASHVENIKKCPFEQERKKAHAGKKAPSAPVSIIRLE